MKRKFHTVTRRAPSDRFKQDFHHTVKDCSTSDLQSRINLVMSQMVREQSDITELVAKLKDRRNELTNLTNQYEVLVSLTTGRT